MSTKKSLITYIFLVSSLFCYRCFSQSNYDKLKEFYQTSYQSCYKEICNELPFGCDSIPDSLFSNLTARACQTECFLKQDSILSLYVDSVRYEIKKWNDTILIQNFDSLQYHWNSFMVTQGYMIYEKNKHTFSGHTRSLFILRSHLNIINIRIRELKTLLDYYKDLQF